MRRSSAQVSDPTPVYRTVCMAGALPIQNVGQVGYTRALSQKRKSGETRQTQGFSLGRRNTNPPSPHASGPGTPKSLWSVTGQRTAGEQLEDNAPVSVSGVLSILTGPGPPLLVNEPRMLSIIIGLSSTGSLFIAFTALYPPSYRSVPSSTGDSR